MKRLVSLLLAGMILSACGLKKEVKKSTRDTEVQNDKQSIATTVTEEKRDGGSIRTGILPVDMRPRDEFGALEELVQEIKDGGLTKTIYYKPDGTVDVDCTADEIWTRIEKRLEERDNSKTITEESSKKKDEDMEFNPQYLLYGLALVIFLALVGLGVLFWMSSKQRKLFESVLHKLH